MKTSGRTTSQFESEKCGKVSQRHCINIGHSQKNKCSEKEANHWYTEQHKKNGSEKEKNNGYKAKPKNNSE